MIEEILNRSKAVLDRKAEEYSSDINRFHNFDVIARIEKIPAEKALWGLFLKHFVSLKDIVENIPDTPSDELLEEKITDSINYLVLLEMLIKRRSNLVQDVTYRYK